MVSMETNQASESTTGTTVTTEEIEKAAYLHDTYDLTRSDAVDLITDALRALGIRIEGDD